MKSLYGYVPQAKYPNLIVITNHYAHLRFACKIHYLYAFRCLLMHASASTCKWPVVGHVSVFVLL